MRLFVSVDFTEEIIKEVQAWFPELKGWKKVRNHQIHLTLAFLGECTDEQLSIIHQELSKIKFEAFTVTIQGLSAFPNEKFPRVIWAGIEPEPELMQLQAKVYNRLQDYINTKNSHTYIPHLTLARKKSRRGKSQTAKQFLNTDTPVLKMIVKEFNLKKSILKSTGSEHEILHRYNATSKR